MSSKAPEEHAPALASELKVHLVVEQLNRQVPGGIGTYARGLVQGLSSLGALPQVSISLYASAARRAQPRGGSDVADGFAFEHAAFGPLLSSRLWEHGIGKIASASDVVHATSFAFPPTRASLVVTVHDLAWRHEVGALSRHARSWHERALRRAAKKARCFVVPSTEVHDELVSTGLVEASAVQVIEEGSDHLAPADDALTAELLSRLGVTDRFILSVGTLEPRKNLESLIAGYSAARASGLASMPLVVVGPAGWGTPSAPSAGVLFVGKVDEAVLAGLYRRAHLLAYVPFVEGFGLPVVEAMRAGCPVVSSAVPSSSSATFLVDPFRVESIAEGLVRVSGDDALRADLVRRGTMRSRALTWERAARSHVELWQSLSKADR